MILLPIALMFAAIGFAGGFAAGCFLRHRRNRGEALVAAAITTQFPRPHVLLNNVTFQAGTETTQIDHLLVADTGIFVIETKHYTGWILGHPKDRQWTQVIYQKKSRFQNPLRQNYGHLKTVAALFSLPDTAFFPLVVFTGDAELKGDFGPTVLRLHELVAYLSDDRPVLFDERKMAYIIGRIEMQRMRRSLETDEYHLDSVRRRIESRRQ